MLFFLSSLLVWWCSFLIFPRNLHSLLSKRPDSFLIWEFYFFRCCLFPTFYCKHVQSHSYVLTVNSYCLYQCIQFLYIFANSLLSSMKIRWLISPYESMRFLIMKLSDNIAITNSNGESESSWKIPIHIFPSAKVFPLLLIPLSSFFTASVIKFMTFDQFRYSIFQLWHWVKPSRLRL